MHIIARPAIVQAKQRYPKASAWLDAWWVAANKAAWTRLMDVQDAFPGTDEVGQCLVFNACGNDYRLICRMTYANPWNDGTLLVKHFLTHADYDKKKWCKDCIPPEKKK
jgi:mRNA-degrading endonuclease HigB of HigAB toxin-antitoxin module